MSMILLDLIIKLVIKMARVLNSQNTTNVLE
jgi:hypothetical protein